MISSNDQMNQVEKNQVDQRANRCASKFASKYADIIDLPHHVSKRHPQMALSDRAAQFGAYAALRGYDEAVTETVKKSIQQTEAYKGRVPCGVQGQSPLPCGAQVISNP